MSDYQQQIVNGFVDEIFTTIHKYNETMLLATVLGCLDVIKNQLIKEHEEEQDK